jgi:hypothetical protein
VEEPGQVFADLAATDTPAEAIQEILEGGAERVGRLIAIGRQLSHRAIANLRQLGVGVGHHVADARLGAREPPRHDRSLRVALCEALGSHGLPQHHAHAEDVGSRVHCLETGLLGRDVRQLALEHATLRGGRCPGRLRDAEVDDLHLAVVGYEHVLRAHVAVDYRERRAVEVAQRMRVVQARSASAMMRTWMSSGIFARSVAQDRVQRLAVE